MTVPPEIDDLAPIEQEFLDAYRAMSEDDQQALARVIHSHVAVKRIEFTKEKLDELMKLAKQLQ